MGHKTSIFIFIAQNTLTIYYHTKYLDFSLINVHEVLNKNTKY